MYVLCGYFLWEKGFMTDLTWSYHFIRNKYRLYHSIVRLHVYITIKHQKIIQCSSKTGEQQFLKTVLGYFVVKLID